MDALPGYDAWLERPYQEELARADLEEQEDGDAWSAEDEEDATCHD